VRTISIDPAYGVIEVRQAISARVGERRFHQDFDLPVHHVEPRRFDAKRQQAFAGRR
jgi:hypothetical protein